MVLHVWLHWSWLCSTVSQLFGGSSPQRSRRIVCGVALLLLLTAMSVGGLFWADSQVRDNPALQERETIGRTHKARASDRITGQLTLAEAARSAGIPVEQLIKELAGKYGVSPHVDPRQRLGSLKREYGFEINDIRQVVDQLRSGSE
jgi:hypothetical protein